MKILEAEAIPKEQWLDVLLEMPYRSFREVVNVCTPCVCYEYFVEEKDDSAQARIGYLEYLMFKINSFTRCKIDIFSGEKL